MQKTGREWKDIVNQYFAEYLEVMDALRCNSVDVYAFATDYIDDIITQILGLVKKGHAYVAEDGSVYYDTTTFSGWGKLSGQKVESLRPGPESPSRNGNGIPPISSCGGPGSRGSPRGTARGAKAGPDGTSRTRRSRSDTSGHSTTSTEGRRN